MVEYVKLNDIEEDKGIPNEDSKKTSKKYRISFKKLFYLMFILFLISMIISSISLLVSPKIAVVPIKGVILTEKSNSIFTDSISSRDIAKQLDELKKDDSVKAILLDINSPGGSPVASEEISKAIDDVKKIKPVYALINDIGASGAFWISVSSDKIYASSMSTVGSIGVTSAGLSFENFIKNYNITYRKLTAGEYKDIGSIYRKQTEEEKEILQNMLNDIHSKFIEHIANERNLSYDYVKQYATGEIFLGDKAKEIGFIDEIGYYPDVIQELKNITNNEDLIIVEYNDEPTLLQEIGIQTLFQSNSKSLIMLQ